MRTTAKVMLGTGAALVIGALSLSTPVFAAGGKAPSSKACNDKENPPKDAVTKGGCVVIDRAKGNCMACHQFSGVDAYGNIATKFENMPARYAGDEGKKRLKDQIVDSTKANPNTVMPPFGRHGILTADEIDQVVEFVLSL